MGESGPNGYETIELRSGSVVAREEVLADIQAALGAGTLYDFARGRPDARAFRGRGAAFAFTAPRSGTPMLVRRSRHGGLFAPITGDIFLRPGRAPHELETAATLRDRGIATPEVLAHIRYWIALAFCRSDVVTRFVPEARDLAALLREERDNEVRAAALHATVFLLASLSAARAVHPDLNLRNILISGSSADPRAWVLDVDRVAIDTRSSEAVARANLARLLRSIKRVEIQERQTLLNGPERSLLASAEGMQR